MSSIPGLISINEEMTENGGARFIFEIEDGKEDLFFSAFGLQVGDEEGFQRVVLEALTQLLSKMEAER